MAKARRSASCGSMCMKALLVLPVLFAVWMGLYDRNMLIQMPAWMLFSYCYLADTYTTDYCNDEAWLKVSNWIWDHTDWSQEKYQPYSWHNIPEIPAANFSYKLMEELTQGFTHPVLVKGLFKDSKATTKWTPEYFKTKYGENILIILSEGRVHRQYDNMDPTNKVRSGYQGIMKPYKMKLRNAISRMEQGESMYLSNVDTIFRKNNDLVDDVEFERITPWAYPNYVPYAAQMFMGFGRADRFNTTGTLMHCAASANLFIQVAGSKNWTFIPPRYAAFVSPRIGRNTPAASVRRRVPERVPRFTTHITAGDMLFNPPWMWHEIENGEGFNVGIATRENHPLWILRNNPLFTFLLEFTATPRVARVIIPKDRVATRIIAGIPTLSFMISFVKEQIYGPLPSPLFTAAFNPCDEHDPNGCTSTILDKVVYSDDEKQIEYRE